MRTDAMHAKPGWGRVRGVLPLALPECPIEQAIRARDARAQAALLDEAQKRPDRSTDAWLVADADGVRAIARTEGALRRLVSDIVERHAPEVVAGAPRVRYAHRPTLSEPWMRIAASGPVALLPLVLRDLERRRGRTLRVTDHGGRSRCRRRLRSRTSWVTRTGTKNCARVAAGSPLGSRATHRSTSIPVRMRRDGANPMWRRCARSAPARRLRSARAHGVACDRRTRAGRVGRRGDRRLPARLLREQFPGLVLERAPGLLPLTFARLRADELRQERTKYRRLGTCRLASRFRVGEFRRVDEFDLPVAAHADAVLRPFETAAADALPCLQRFDGERSSESGRFHAGPVPPAAPVARAASRPGVPHAAGDPSGASCA